MIASVFLIIFASKLWVIALYASPVPFWDQWDAEAEHLFKPYLEGRFGWTDLFAPHNEHRIAITRLTSLALLQLNGFWDPILEMIVNAAIHCVVISCFAAMMIRTLPAFACALLPVFVGFVFLPPWGHENTLWGFQSQFYFSHLTALASLWLCWKHPALTPGWWAGILIAAIGFFTMAAGAFVPAVIAATLIAQFIATRTAPLPRRIALVIAGLATVAGLLLIKQVPGHQVLKASGPVEFIDAAGRMAAWPAKSPWLALVMQTPVAVLLVWLWLRREKPDRPVWLVVALGLWCWLQIAATAYARGSDGVAGRYTDTLALSWCVQFAALLLLVNEFADARRLRVAWFSFTAIWLVAGTSGWVKKLSTIPEELAGKAHLSSIQETNVKAYLATGDIKHLEEKPHLHIPYPSPTALKNWLDDPTLRAILPTTLKSPEYGKIHTQAQGFTSNGTYPGTPMRMYEQVLGSYGAAGDATQGSVSLTFVGQPRSSWYEWNLAGQPKSGALSLVITDAHGRSHLLVPENEPRESWKPVRLKLPAGPFTVTATDQDQQKWIAFTAPRLLSSLSLVAVYLLDNSLLMFGLGMALLFFSCLWTAGLNQDKCLSHEKPAGPR